MTVPCRLQQPLHVDTDMNYDLDMSKFPGLDDPHQMYQPALLIGTYQNNVNSSNSLEHVRNKSHSVSSTHCHVSTEQHTGPTTLDVLEELLNVIDSCSEELLDRLVDSNIQNQLLQTADNMYKSVKDACVYDPESKTVSGNTHANPQNIHVMGNIHVVLQNVVPRENLASCPNGVSQNTHMARNTHAVPENGIVTRTTRAVSQNTRAPQNPNVSIRNSDKTTNSCHPSGDRCTMMHYYSGLGNNRPACDTITDILPYQCSNPYKDGFQGFLPGHDSFSDSVGCKRKRSLDTCDFPVFKRQCYRPNTINYYGAGYTTHYPSFHESVSNRGLVV